jgi:hypothetical protein
MTPTLRDELLETERMALAEVEQQLELLQRFSAAHEDSFERQRRLLLQQAEIESRAARVREAPEGEEFLLRIVPALLELRPGDNFLDKLATEILLEDGIVQGFERIDRARLEPPELEQAS